MAGAGTQHGQSNANDVKLKVSSLIKEFEHASLPPVVGKECCIYRVHQCFREISGDDAYTPKVVSIGPFHHDKILGVTRETKMSFVSALFTRVTTIKEEQTELLKECEVSIANIENEARNCYSERFNLSSNEFVDMMVLDGLFIIELLLRKAEVVETNGLDPFLRNLVCDLVKLENQLPMRVLNCLFEQPKLKALRKDSPNITKLILGFFNSLMLRDADDCKECSATEVKHLLDLLSKKFVRSAKPVDTKNNSSTDIPNVAVLEKMGMRFKKGSLNKTLVEIEFTGGDILGFRNSVLEFCPVTIRHQTSLLLGNLIAFEEYRRGKGHVNHITSYAFLMYQLLKSANDVSPLINQGIIKNYLDNEEQVSHIYKLAREATLSEFYYSALCDQVQSYCNSLRCRVWRKFTWQNVFTHWINPATVLSLISVVFGIYAAFIALESLKNDKSESKDGRKMLGF